VGCPRWSAPARVGCGVVFSEKLINEDCADPKLMTCRSGGSPSLPPCGVNGVAWGDKGLGEVGN
jgi:hypothetical protein